MTELNRRKIYTEDAFARLQSRIVKASKIADESNACIYATGSVGRLEAGEHSDFDLVIVTKGAVDKDRETAESCMNLLNEIRMKADVIEAMRDLRIKDLDGQGKFFRKYTAVQLANSIGEQHDDWENTLTSRLLLLLESRPLIGARVHEHAIDTVLASYWTDYERHQGDYVPAFFTNDILRLWRTFCVNYEARTKNLPDDQKMVRKIKNLKLKYSRMLTCYSAIFYMLSQYSQNGTVTIESAKHMTSITPVERLLKVAEGANDGGYSALIDDIINRYDRFLLETNKPETDLIEYMKLEFDRMRGDAHLFGDKIYEALSTLKNGRRYYRMIVV